MSGENTSSVDTCPDRRRLGLLRSIPVLRTPDGTGAYSTGALKKSKTRNHGRHRPVEVHKVSRSFYSLYFYKVFPPPS